MEPILEKPFDQSRALLFGLLQGCIFSENAKDDCPLLQLGNKFSLTEKYDYIMELSAGKINKLLGQHEECFEKKVLS